MTNFSFLKTTDSKNGIFTQCQKFIYDIRHLTAYLTLAVMSFCFFSCGDSSDEPASGSDTETFEDAIVGNWYWESINGILPSHQLFVFHKDGKFTSYYKRQFSGYSPDYSIATGSYTTNGSEISLTIPAESKTHTGTFSISNQTLTMKFDNYSLGSGDFYQSSLTNLDNIIIGKSYLEVTPSDPVKDKSPYKNFMHGSYSGTHCYVELTKVEMQAQHGIGGEANFKYLRFCGTNGDVSPNGALILYSRPSWEGIEKYWPDGTYTVKSGGGYWSYAIHPYFNGKDYISSEGEGTLTIKSNGNYKTFDYKSDLLVIHFEGTFSH